MLIFFDSDTQNDFISATGRFPIPNGENIRKNLSRLTAFARKNKIKIISSVDRHFGTEKFKNLEFSELSIWGGPFPMHCMDGTSGQKKIKETAPKKAVYVENKKLSQTALKKISNSPEIIFEKQKFSAFSNENLPKVLKMLKVHRAIIYGVQTDYSIRTAVLDMRKMGIEVFLVTDASRGINVKPSDAELSIRQMQAAGVRAVGTDYITKQLPLKQ